MKNFLIITAALAAIIGGALYLLQRFSDTAVIREDFTCGDD